MTVATVYKQGWTLDEVHWDWFDPTRVEPGLLAAVKAAALVEFNAPDYVTYLKRVFHDAGPQTLATIEQWGAEEGQHGKALGRYAEMADPTFRMDEAFARFRKGYTPAHFGSNHAALADDSGLCVDALGGDPGIYSARWAGPTKDFRVAMNRIHDELRKKGLTTSKAKFVCALTVALPSGEAMTFEGEVHGA